MPDRTVIQGVYLRRADGTVPLTRREFRYELQCCRDRCGGGWGSQPLRFHAAQFEAPLRKLRFGKASRKEVPEL